MKSAIIFILIGLVAFLGFSISGLRKELLSVKEYARQIQERNSKLQRELMRLSRVNSENEPIRFAEINDKIVDNTSLVFYTM